MAAAGLAGNDTPATFVGTGGRLRSKRMAAFNRNPRPQSSESAVKASQPAGSEPCMDGGNTILEA
jgi:hypothetical protein